MLLQYRMEKDFIVNQWTYMCTIMKTIIKTYQGINNENQNYYYINVVC